MENPGASKPHFQYPGGTLRGAPLLVIAAVALALVVPFCFLGIPSGHDFEFHLNSWIEVLSQWRQGIIYPRWAALAHYGYGDARFLFYPPASWTLGAALGAILPWKLVPGAYQWLVLALSGCSMFLLARRWVTQPDAVFAAAFYVVNPYYVVIVYWRSAFAELLAGALLPLLALYVLELDEHGRKAIVPLALIMAAAFLTNAPAAVMVSYSLAVLALILTVLRRSPKLLLYSAAASVLGAALAAFYLLPASYEQRWVNIDQVLSPGVRPQDNFLFSTTPDPDHNRFNQLVSTIAVAELMVFALAAFLSRKHWRENPWRPLLFWGSLCGLLMFSFTALLWSYLPLLRFLQFPWRWLLCLNVAFVIVLTIAWKRWPWRVLVLLFLLATLVFGWHRIQVPWWDNARDIADMLYQQQNGAGYEGTDEYAPLGADPYNIDLHAPKVALESGAPLRVRVQQWSSESRLFLVDAAQPGKLVLRLFNYPAWRVEVNGQKANAESQEGTGQMLIPIAVGENRVQLTFIRTWDRTVGEILSLVTAVGLLLWSWKKRLGHGPT